MKRQACKGVCFSSLKRSCLGDIRREVTAGSPMHRIGSRSHDKSLEAEQSLCLPSAFCHHHHTSLPRVLTAMPTIRRPPPRLPVRQRPLPRPRAAHRRLQTRAGPPAGSFTANPPPPLDNLSLAEWSAQAEDDIARLAAQPLRDLALADLVRSAAPPAPQASCAGAGHADRPGSDGRRWRRRR